MTATIKRQIELVEHTHYERRVETRFTGIVYTHWSDGTITRRETNHGEDTKVGYQAIYPVDHDRYQQHIDFVTFIALHAYKMTWQEAIQAGLLPNRPETISERAERRKQWFENAKDNRRKQKKQAASVAQETETVKPMVLEVAS